MRRWSLFLSIVLVLSFVFTISCVSKEVPITETYYETEYNQEPYITTESYENVIPHEGDNLVSKMNGGETYILLNRSSNGSIKWAIVTAGTQYPVVRSLSIQSSGKNHRISVSLSENNPKKLLSATILSNRSSEGIKLGFKPKPLPTNYSAMVSNCQRAYPFMSSSQCEESVIGGTASQFGFSMWEMSDSNVFNVSSANFLFADLFNVSGWSLIDIMSDSTYSVDYVWDEVQTATREVTKYRDVPVQVQKQRTVMQTKHVPFWEAIFH